ncbi:MULTISPECIES: hypothetical protein [unclassified Lysobacter]|uniref:hypothetical protein n=1 Tax=unclassified Lysobacter TaxID=2635362 RepID=UPI001BEBCDB4|nr:MULTISPECIES: hypothetical protein [unclassified Lysobacter]MBT2746519.1 hypothetical protein [Lysobacter sp. ISL-42]MBT2753021.1 hypothetical protein [Lysobacter sp. ISL-50]MBT2777698.1 hypothetical protein [Lysobacter sp. ISL-54]MBT2782469.1 hypothetical protein [Lysobacter sp. ISL-52]
MNLDTRSRAPRALASPARAPRPHALRVFAFCLVIAAATLSAPAWAGLPEYRVSVANTDILRHQADAAPMRIGRFTAARGADDQATQEAAEAAVYLRDALSAELQAAGRLSAQATIDIDGDLRRYQVGPAPSSGINRASVVLHVSVRRDGAVAMQRDLSIEQVWPHAGTPWIARSLTSDRLLTAMQSLLRQLYSDPQFKRVTAR